MHVVQIIFSMSLRCKSKYLPDYSWCEIDDHCASWLTRNGNSKRGRTAALRRSSRLRNTNEARTSHACCLVFYSLFFCLFVCSHRFPGYASDDSPIACHCSFLDIYHHHTTPKTVLSAPISWVYPRYHLDCNTNDSKSETKTRGRG